MTEIAILENTHVFKQPKKDHQRSPWLTALTAGRDLPRRQLPGHSALGGHEAEALGGLGLLRTGPLGTSSRDSPDGTGVKRRIQTM